MNPSTLLARAVVDVLVADGVREVVLCPGSRSAPLAYALHAADAAGRLRLHVRHDERSAAFTALGAGCLGTPAAVVTTSGTAVANLLPAVLEASEAGVPLVVLSADRPHALRGSWANQTTALQAGLFGGAVRAALDLPVPAPSEPLARAVRTWQAGVRDLLRTASGGAPGSARARPGPVHADLALDDPLVPDGDPAWPGAPAGPAPDGGAAPPPRTEDLLAALGDSAGPTVVVAGDGAGPLARTLAEDAGWPLLAEPSSGARAGSHAVAAYRLLLAEERLGGAVRRAVVLGRPTLSRAGARRRAPADRGGVAVGQPPRAPPPPPPGRRGGLPGLAAPLSGAPLSGALLSGAPLSGAPLSGDSRANGRQDGPAHDDPRANGRRGGAGEWLQAWQRAGAAARAAVDAVLDAEAAAGRMTGPLVAREVAAATGAGELLVAAASNPVRDLDLAAQPWPGELPLVLANRGLAGIDGTVSTAAGAALAAGARARVLVGDVALLHDANGLLLGPGEPEPDLQVVVVNDDGGGIFTGLEHGEPARAATFERLFGTPHGADLGALAAALGVPHVRADDVDGLRAVLAAPRRGRSVVEVRTDRTALRALHERVGAAVADAVAAAVEGAGPA